MSKNERVIGANDMMILNVDHSSIQIPIHILYNYYENHNVIIHNSII